MIPMADDFNDYMKLVNKLDDIYFMDYIYKKSEQK